MSEVNIDEKKILRAMRGGLISVVELAEEKIIENTPRDKNRLPKNTKIKVTWNLKRSIWHEEKGLLEFDIGVKQGDDAENYAWHQEFWTPHMEARSYLRKWIIENTKAFTDLYAKVVQRLLK